LLGPAGAVVVTVLAAVLAGLGWLYVLRGLGWFGGGPQIHDSLPLLQLARRDIQPLERVLVAWLAAGIVAGALLVRLPRVGRALAVELLALALLLVASQASFAVTRNLSFGHILFSRIPEGGPWLEAALLAIGCAIPGRIPRRRPVDAPVQQRMPDLRLHDR
jgi:hypothetical protein